MVSLLQLQKDKYTGKELMDILAEKYKESNWHVFKIFMDNKLLHEHSTIQLPITTHLLIVLSNPNKKQNNINDGNCTNDNVHSKKQNQYNKKKESNEHIDEDKKYDSASLPDSDTIAKEFYSYFLLNEPEVCKSIEEKLERISNIKKFLKCLQNQREESLHNAKYLSIITNFCDSHHIDHSTFLT
ncbi:hypothetical protein RFI_37778, partial [Reticulomyxa filosa]